MPLDKWIKALPASKPAYPASFIDRIKYHVWGLYTPYHSSLRDTLLRIGIIQHQGRQDFLLGRIAPHLTIQQFVSYLVDQGYGNHFIAWRDDGELLSLRYAENFDYQYHLRVYEDGEVRGHYEYTPESHPILHIKEVGAEDRSEIFLDLLGDRITRLS